MVEVSPTAPVRAMELITILNRCHRFRGFVYQQAQLAKFEAAREDESATRAGKARWRVFWHSQDAWLCVIPGLGLVYSVWLPL